MTRILRSTAPLAALAATAGALAAQTPAPSVTVGGVIYGQYAYALRNPTGAGHQNNFDITRAYVNVLGRFTQGVGSRVTGDVYRNTDGSLAYRLKYAYASYNPSGTGSGITFKFGQTQTPFLEYDENLWDYRMQGQDAAERAGYMSSSDFGFGVDGSWKGDMVTLQSGVYNGEFYSKAPGDKHKDVEGRVSVRLVPSDDPSRFGGLRLTGFASVGEPNGGGRRNRFLGEASYRSKLLTLAGVFLATRDRTDSTLTAPTTRGSLFSFFGVLHLLPSKANLIARFDLHDPNTQVANNRLSRVIAGASYQINPNLRVLADVDHTWYQGGGAPTPAIDAARSQALFQIQLAF